MITKGCYAILLLVSTWLLAGCDAPNQQAGILYEQAQSHAKAMLAAENYGNALAEYVATVDATERMLSKYPSSDIAEELMAGKINIAGCTWQDFKTLQESLQPLAEAEKDSILCARAIRKAADTNVVYTSFNIDVAESYIARGDREMANQLLSQVIDSTYSNTNQQDKARVFMHCATVLEELGEHDRASSLLNAAQEILTDSAGAGKRRRWTAGSLSTIAVKYFDSGDAERGEHTLNLALELINQETESYERDFALSIIFFKLYDAGYFSRAINIINDNAREEERRSLLYFAAQECEEDDHLAQLLSSALSLTNEFDRDGILGMLASRYSERGQFPQATLIVTSQMTGAFEKDNAWGSIANQYTERNRFLDAIQCANQISDEPDKAEVLTAIAIAQEEAGETEQAEELFRWVEDFTRTLSYAPVQVSALCSVADKYIEAGKIPQATGLLARASIIAGALRNVRYRADVGVPDIAQLYLKLDQRDIAENLLSIAKTWAPNSIDDDAKSRLLTEIAEVYAKAGELSQALDALDPIEVDDWDMEKIQDSFVEIHVANGTTDALLEALQACRNRIDYNDCLEHAADLLQKNGKIAESLQIADSMETNFARTHIILEATSLYNEQRQFSKALKSLTRIEKPFLKASSLLEIAQATAEANHELNPDEIEQLTQFLLSVYPLDAFWKKHGLRL